MKISEQIALAETFCFVQVFVFCWLIKKNVLEWFLPVMCKEQALSRSTKLLSRNMVFRNTWLGNTIIIFVVKQIC